MTYRALLIILIALLMALSAYVGFAVGITFAASRPSPVTSASLPDVQARTGAPSIGVKEGSGSDAAGVADPDGAPTPPAAALEQPSASRLEPSAVPVRETANPRLTVAKLAFGLASWHATGRDGLYAAAGPALRVGDWRGRQVEVCAARCIVVTLNDWCLCVVDGRERLLDLSDESFAALGDLRLGLLSVTVRVP